MSIGNIASSIWGPSARPLPTNQKPSGAAPIPAAPPSVPPAGSGPADPFALLSADTQARLLQLQAAGADTAPGSSVTASAGTIRVPPHHHHPHSQNGDTGAGASDGLVPTQAAPGATTTAGASSASPGAGDNSLFDAVRQAIQAYAASGASTRANLTTSLATVA
jgi:hypothetical protein